MSHNDDRTGLELRSEGDSLSFTDDWGLFAYDVV